MAALPMGRAMDKAVGEIGARLKSRLLEPGEDGWKQGWLM